MPKKVYLGDAVYCEFDGNRIVLTTEDGISATNTIVLEREVYGGLVNYLSACAAAQHEAEGEGHGTT